MARRRVVHACRDANAGEIALQSITIPHPDNRQVMDRHTVRTLDDEACSIRSDHLVIQVHGCSARLVPPAEAMKLGREDNGLEGIETAVHAQKAVFVV